MEYYIRCKCGQRYFIEPKDDSNVFLCSCGKKNLKRNWIAVFDAEWTEVEDDE